MMNDIDNFMGLISDTFLHKKKVQEICLKKLFHIYL